MKILITADFKGLDIIMGRQLGCPTSVGIHTSLRLGDISGKGHGGHGGHLDRHEMNIAPN